MKRPFGNLAIAVSAIMLGLIAGFGGAWLGMSRAAAPTAFPQAVSQLLERSEVALTPAQRDRIADLRAGYESERAASGTRLRTALVALAEAVVQSGDNRQEVDAAAALVDSIVHERRMASIAYISRARGLLEPGQRAAFDEAFLQVVANDPSYTQ